MNAPNTTNVDAPPTTTQVSQVTIQAPTIVTQGGVTALAGLGGFPVTRILDEVIVFGIDSGPGTASGFPIEGSAEVSAAG